MSLSSPRSGVLHQYTANLTAFEHSPNSNSQNPPNLIIFIGGLFDGLLTVPYASRISDSLPPTWTLAQVVLSSSYRQWGFSSLQKDVAELSKCVSYFRPSKPGKIVLMGHSTGCQDVMEYLTGKGHQKRAPIDGGIIQAPASDREALAAEFGPAELTESCSVAHDMVSSGEGNEILKFKYTKTAFSAAPVTARRFLSLASPNHDGDDDYFSSDLSDEQLLRTFGSLPVRSPLCILFSGNDEYVPNTFDKKTLVERWISIVRRGQGSVDTKNSGILEGATHNLKGDSDAIVNDLVKRVQGFLGGLTEQSNL